MTRYIAAEAGPYGVRVNSVIPGFIIKDEHQERYQRDDNQEFRDRVNSIHPVRKAGCADDVANAVAFLCSDAASFITGTELVVDGGMTIQDQWKTVAPPR